MGKLSHEAWTVAFFDVMKEKLPVSVADMRRVQKDLEARHGTAQRTADAAKAQAREAGQRADDAEEKRGGAAQVLHEATLATVDGSPRRADAKRGYQDAEAKAGQTAREAKDARGAAKEADYAVNQVKAQLDEVKSRIEKKDLAGLSPELKVAVQQAQLALGVKAKTELLQSLEAELEGKRTADTRGLSTWEEEAHASDLKSVGDMIKTIELERDKMSALLEGFETSPAPVAPSATTRLAESAEKLAAVAKQADKDRTVKQNNVHDKQEAVSSAQMGVEAAAQQDPGLTAAMGEVVAKREQQGKAVQAVGEAQLKAQTTDVGFRKAQATLDSYAAGGAKPPSAKEVNEAMLALETGVTDLVGQKTAMRVAQDGLRKAAAETQAAEVALADAIQARIDQAPRNKVLEKAQEVLKAAKEDLRRAEAALEEAAEDAERLEGMAADAKRRLQVATVMPEATKAVNELNGALKGLEDQPIWDGSEALQEKLGPKKFAQLQQLGTKFINQYEKLSANGADIGELQALFKDTPEEWKPPRFREDEQNWTGMKDLLNDEAEDKYRKESNTTLESIKGKLEKARGVLDKGASAGLLLTMVSDKGKELGEMIGDAVDSEAIKAIGKALENNKELANTAAKAIGSLSALMSTVSIGVSAGDSGSKSMETEDPIETLMLQEEFMGELGKLLSALPGAIRTADKFDITGAVIKQMAGLLPAVGVVVNAADVMKRMVEAASRVQEAMDDSDAHAEAVQDKHQLEPAIDQFQRRDKHLAARAATATAISGVKTVAAGLDLAVVLAPVSGGMKAGAAVVGGVQSAAEMVIDRSEGEKAQALLKLAQAGNGNARKELFRFHPRYAKGILSVMASEGDPMALRVLSTHGLSEDMIKRSSPKIIKRYLLKKFGETDEPGSWTSLYEGLTGALKTAGEKLKAIDDFFGNIADKMLARFDSNELVQVQAALSDYAYALPGQAVSTAVTSLVEVRRQRETLAKSATGDQALDLEAMDKVLEGELATVKGITEKVLGSLEKVRLVIDRIETMPKEPLQQKAATAAKVVLREHLARVQELSLAA